jgi:glycosyltransferase involved in cell wall biosynthesis
MSQIEGKLSVIMPAYNEGNHIYENILETWQVFEDARIPYEIIVVDDGSTDQTASQGAKAAAELSNVIFVKQPKNMGKGWALRTGFEKVTGDYVVFLDSDLDLHPSQLELFFKIMKQENTDIVIGSKRHPDSQLNYPKDRKFISSGYFFMIKVMFGLPIKDTQTGLKLFKIAVLRDVFPRILVKRMAYDLELLAVAHYYGYKISEAPVVLNHHFKFGRLGVSAIWDTWWDTMAVFYRLRILRYYRQKKS